MSKEAIDTAYHYLFMAMTLVSLALVIIINWKKAINILRGK